MHFLISFCFTCNDQEEASASTLLVLCSQRCWRRRWPRRWTGRWRRSCARRWCWQKPTLSKKFKPPVLGGAPGGEVGVDDEEPGDHHQLEEEGEEGEEEAGDRLVNRARSLEKFWHFFQAMPESFRARYSAAWFDNGKKVLPVQSRRWQFWSSARGRWRDRRRRGRWCRPQRWTRAKYLAASRNRPLFLESSSTAHDGMKARHLDSVSE